MWRINKNTVCLVVLSVCLLCAWPIKSQALSDRIYKDLSTFSKVLDIVDKFYVTQIDEHKTVLGAIDGMLMALDPHTVYMPADEYKNFSSDTRGKFGGVGIEVSIKDGILTVIAPIEGTPAWDAGLKAGDKIIAIDGKSTKNMPLYQAVTVMRGRIGGKLSLTIWREGKKRARTVTITRTLINVPSVRTEDLGDGYALFRITIFQEEVARDLKKAIDDFVKAKGSLKGIILDLRDNPGGLLTEAVKVSDFFLDRGVIVSTKGRTSDTDVKRAHEAGTYPNFPLVVLINGGSASASEIVAGALQDNGRAKLFGTTSFGKGSVQTVINLENGDALKITIAHYFTPKDKLIDGKGIEPDVVLDTKDYQKKFKINPKDKKQDNKLGREEFYNWQKQEAAGYLKRGGR